MSGGQTEQRPGSGNLKPWRKGQSGNPGGRPKGIESLAREYTPRALEALALALDDPSTRVPAAIALLDRGWGRPKQTIAGDPDNPVSYVIRGPASVGSTAEWIKLHAPRMIDADPDPD